ncbi:MAG: hypothetical protein Q9M28_05900 [Mariprofundaceae bacterium]|nr:hypothetical protein [Mariprofundaceae bacterium]
MNFFWVILFSLLLLGCVSKAPIQEMSDARLAVTVAQDLLKEKPSKKLMKARENLEQATIAIEEQDFNRARYLAKKAKIQAQTAVKEK